MPRYRRPSGGNQWGMEVGHRPETFVQGGSAQPRWVGEIIPDPWDATRFTSLPGTLLQSHLLINPTLFDSREIEHRDPLEPEIDQVQEVYLSTIDSLEPVSAVYRSHDEGTGKTKFWVILTEHNKNLKNQIYEAQGKIRAELETDNIGFRVMTSESEHQSLPIPENAELVYPQRM